MQTENAPTTPIDDTSVLKGFWKILSHPITGILFGAAFSWYLFEAGQRGIVPTFASSDPNTVVSPEVTDGHLSIYWNDIKVQNVLSVKVAFWNGGSRYLDKTDILPDEPIRISAVDVSKEFKILDVRLLKTSRPQLRFKFKIEPDMGSGGDSVRVDVDGNEVLEAMDGGLFEILYTDNREQWPRFRVDARIRGVPSGFARESWTGITHRTSPPMRVVLGGICVLLIFAITGAAIREFRSGHILESAKSAFVVIVLIAIGTYATSIALAPSPGWLLAQ